MLNYRREYLPFRRPLPRRSARDLTALITEIYLPESLRTWPTWHRLLDASINRESNDRELIPLPLIHPHLADTRIVCSCDACRKRKTCCVRDPGYDTCTLCRMRSKKCQFESVPKARPGRRSKAYCTPPGDSTAATQQSSPSQADAGDASKEWIPQFVGLSGDQDPFVLRHCAFNDLNYFKRPDWACLRVDGRRGNATHFVVSISKSSGEDRTAR